MGAREWRLTAYTFSNRGRIMVPLSFALEIKWCAVGELFAIRLCIDDEQTIRSLVNPSTVTDGFTKKAF